MQFDNIPLDAVLFNNPIFNVDAPPAQVYPKMERHDEEPLGHFDLFQMRTMMKRQLELEKKAKDLQENKFVKSLLDVGEIGSS